ncbi:MAG: TIGR03032 family protein [Solirubrobacteraceae bacterium]|nr:TIGR03032 family protein [Solirubrobacteraceae bacterium]
MPGAAAVIVVVGPPGARPEVVAEALEAAVDAGPLLAGPEHAARVGELAAERPDARFVLVRRDLEACLREGVAPDAWHEAAAALLAALEALAPERWCVVGRERLLADPRAELRRLCGFLGLTYDQAMLAPVERARRAEAAGGPARAAEQVAARLDDLLAADGEEAPPPPPVDGPLAFRSSFTTTVPAILRRLGASLLISTYQAGRLVCARALDDQRLNTHFRAFDKPMGIAVAPGRFALGTRTEVWDFRDAPDVAPRLEPPGTHDACYLPRNRHVTGDIAVHEMAFAEGRLWVVATGFSCLATLDVDHSFVPRWRPPFVSAIAPGDRCHLNGLAVRDGRVATVTTLGTADEPGGWRARRADGGVVVDVASGEIVAGGLSMPHSPRWHDGRLYVLESGRGELSVVDEATGRLTTVAALPGFTRGLAFAGPLAFVGLSQIRERSTFGDLPLTRRLDERASGVWVVDLRTGAVAGFVRFEDAVQEVFDVALLPGARHPEIAEPGSSAVATSFVLPAPA